MKDPKDMNKRRVFVIALLLILMSCTATLAAQQAGLVVRSPLFGPAQKESISSQSLEVQSFSRQLGGAVPSIAMDAEQRVLSAIGSGIYPVTPGDMYRLVYLDGMKTVTVDLQVDERCEVVIPSLGTLSGAHLTFVEFRNLILSTVKTYHTYSNPQLVLLRTGAYTVTVVGEVSGTRVVPAWGLTRLSEVISSATSFASTREVTITRRDGTTQSYDLFKALRRGALDKDPLLCSGDVITLTRAQRMIILGGRVYEAGTYQLLEHEGIADLITSYGKGMLNGSDVQNIRVQRYNSESGLWDVHYVDLFNHESFELVHLDQVFVDPLVQRSQSITIEGAVSANEVYDELSSTALVGFTSGRIFYQFYPRETLKQMFETISVRLLSVSDLDGSYLLREGRRIPIKVQQILYGNDIQGNMVLESGDVVVIPFSQRLVSVSGAVGRSGVFAWVPDKGVNYYISLAGGISDDAAYPTSIKVHGPNGERLASNEMIQPESTIIVAKNTFVRDIAPTVAVIGLVSSILGIIATVVNIIIDAKSL